MRSTASRTACSELMLVAAELPAYDSNTAIGIPLGSGALLSSRQAAQQHRAAISASRALPRARPRLGADVPLPIPTTATRITHWITNGFCEGAALDGQVVGSQRCDVARVGGAAPAACSERT